MTNTNDAYASAAETAAVIAAADATDSQYRWLQRMLYAIDPHQYEQGNDGAHVRALEKLAHHQRAIICRALEVIRTIETESAAEHELLDALMDDMKMAAGIKPLVPGSLI